MIQRIPTFFIHETDLFQTAFRRWQDGSWDGECDGPYGYHNAVAILNSATQLPDSARSNRELTPEELLDPRCPVECDWCTFKFGAEARSHYDVWHLYRRDSGELYTLHGSGERAAPPGAMWDASWHPGERKYPDGMFLVLRTPAGDWNIDGKASNGPGWTRTGDPKAEPSRVNVTPSIGFGESCERFHGWLRNGVLEQDGGTAR